MRVAKRNGEFENVSFDKVLRRIKQLAPVGLSVDVVAQKVISQIYDTIKSSELDNIACKICASLAVDHPGYGELAAKIAISNLHKETGNSFSENVKKLYETKFVNERLAKLTEANAETIDKTIDYTRDYLFDYFGFKTLERAYLLPGERPQSMWMRVSLSLYDDIEDALESYDLLSQKYFTHASPTLFNAGTLREQMSSCFLLSTDDSIDGIYKTITDCAKISQHAGGIGFSASNVRSKGSVIRKTNGKSDGIVPMLKVFNETSRYVNQSGKRNGSFAVYLEPWHADIIEFLDLKKNTGDVNLRARDLFYAMWIPNNFMRAVETDDYYYLMCPDECQGLTQSHSEEFEKMYDSYVAQGKYRRKIKAREIFDKILVSQIETGTPYMCYKDHANEKSNQKNIGTITSSNLCAEITLVNNPDSIAVCNIATLGLPVYVKDGEFDYDLLGDVTRKIVRNLNKVIDCNYYPLEACKKNNQDHRPIALGVQGLYDVFMKLKLPFGSPESMEINKKIFEVIQYNAIYESCVIAKEVGSYSTFDGSPASKGIFQHNMWGISEDTLYCNWAKLRVMVKKYGLRNSMLTALPPTASTSQILGNTESFEVPTSNFYTRRVLAGNFPVVNGYLVRDLISVGLWNEDLKNDIILADGSVQRLNVPQNIKDLYKTTWETSQKITIKMSADRGPFVDQSQSLNLFFDNPTKAKLSSAHIYAWKSGLKTGSYYIRSLPASSSEKLSFISKKAETSVSETDGPVCTRDNPDCEACSG